MKQIISISILFLLFSCKVKESIKPTLTIDLSSEIVTPKQYIITKTNEDLVIDGKGNESSWEQALFSDSFIDIEGVKIPKFDTKIKMLWNDQYFYVYAQMEEPHIWGNLRNRDTIIYYNNDFEVFISPSGTTRNYGEIEINSLGTIWDLLLDKPYRDGGNPNNHWNLDNLKSAIHIEGTLNNYNDVDSLWTVELAIPMDALLELRYGKRLSIKEGKQWRVNFSRVEWDFDIINNTYRRKKGDDGKYQPEYNWVWSNQNKINMHEPEKWGTVQFTNKSSSENITFIEDEDMIIKQVAYALFRQTKRGSLKKLLKEKTGASQKVRVKFSDNDFLTSTFHKTNFGFEYILNSNLTKQTYIVNETGILKEIE